MLVLAEPISFVWPEQTETDLALTELERAVRAALETYSNIHRGTGHNSMASTALFERARDIVLEYLGLSNDRYMVIFCTSRRADILTAQLKPASYLVVSSQEIGLPLGVRALAVERRALPRGVPFQTGGGTVRIVSPGSVIWAEAPDKFEAGTPAIVNVIAFAKALQLIRRFGSDSFQGQRDQTATVRDILYQDEFRDDSGRTLLLKLRHAQIGYDIRVPTTQGDKPYTNLDNGVSTPTFSPIWEAVCQTWRQPEPVWRELVHEVKVICSEFLGAPLDAYDVIFASNTTEAINLVAESLRSNVEPGVEPVVLNTLLEHNSNELPWRYIPGASLLRLPVDDEGFVNLRELERLLRDYNQQRQHGKKRVVLVAMSGASNVLGSFNDLAAISRVTHQYNARLLVDAAQLAAHRQVAMADDEIDYLAFSGHKVYAPFGSGALVVRKGLFPADLQQINASGEENVVGIAALGRALTLLRRIGMAVIEDEERALTRRALHSLARITGVQIYGVRDPDSPQFNRKGGVIAFSLKNVPHNLVAKELAEQGGIGVRCGCFCAHLLVKRLLKIHPLRALAADAGLILLPEVTRLILPGLVRISFGIENDEEDVATLVRTLDEIANATRNRRDRLLAFTHNGTLCLPKTETQKQMEGFVQATAARVYSLGESDVQ